MHHFQQTYANYLYEQANKLTVQAAASAQHTVFPKFVIDLDAAGLGYFYYYPDIHCDCISLSVSTKNRAELVKLMLIARSYGKITDRSGFLRTEGARTELSASFMFHPKTGEQPIRVELFRNSCQRVQVGVKEVPVYEVHCE